MAFVIMRGLRNTVEEVTSATAALARGDVRAHVPVSSADEVGQMARTFNGMIDNIRSLAASAEAIGKGNYDTPVPVRGEQDTLGQALSRMRDNLRPRVIGISSRTRSSNWRRRSWSRPTSGSRC
jgi:HAMP domain-containing protein